jgi:hypothetical protein
MLNTAWQALTRNIFHMPIATQAQDAVLRQKSVAVPFISTLVSSLARGAVVVSPDGSRLAWSPKLAAMCVDFLALTNSVLAGELFVNNSIPVELLKQWIKEDLHSPDTEEKVSDDGWLI